MPRKIDAARVLEEVHQDRRVAQRRSYKKSKLDRVRSSLVALRRAGASYPDLVYWLRTKHYIHVQHTTVMRYMKKLPEMSGVDSS